MGWTPSGPSATVTSSTPHSGSYAVMLGLTTPTNGDSNIAQTFTAPNGVTSLSFWYKMTCPDTVTYDWATATLADNTAGGTVTLLPKICTTNAWTQVSATIIPGDNYTLTLTNHDDNYVGDPTYTLFDDFAPSVVDTARLARVNFRNASTQVLGSCVRGGSFLKQSLTVDLDGSILVTSGNAASSQIGHLAITATGSGYLDKVDSSEGGLVVPPIVDANGYSLLTTNTQNATTTNRLTQLAYGAPGQYALCQLFP